MSDTNLIKSITNHICPNCGTEIFIENQITPPVIGSVFTKVEVESAKQDLLSRIETLGIDDEKKATVTKWIRDPETVFGPGEVESIILSLLKSDEE